MGRGQFHSGVNGLIDEELGLQIGQMRGFEEIKGACLTSVGGGGYWNLALLTSNTVETEK